MPYADFQNEPFTDFSDPAHKQAFEAALAEIQKGFGAEHPAWIGGEQITDRPKIESRDPGDLDRLIGSYAKCDAHAERKRACIARSSAG